MEQLSIFSAEACGEDVADLAGVLCGQGKAVSFGRTAARLSVVLEQQWRASPLAGEFTRRGIDAEVTTTEGGHPLVRTAFRANLLGLATGWNRGAVKAVPPGFRLDGPTLRVWVLAHGTLGERGYLLGLDRRAPETHAPLVAALGALGLRGSVVGPRAGGPAVRFTGRRRLATMAELVGDLPEDAGPVSPVYPVRAEAATSC